MTIAHEVAHQWWAIAVGSDSVREPFVDESLTNYSAVLYFEDRYGREIVERMIQTHLKMPYSMARLLGLADAPVNLPTSAYGGNLHYSAIVYGKGALYYEALRRAMGTEAFFSALRTYYAKYRGGLAGPRSLLDIAIASAPSAGAEALYRRWIEEIHGDEDIGGGGMPGLQDLLGETLKKATRSKQ
jgi:aminopeptidase N